MGASSGLAPVKRPAKWMFAFRERETGRGFRGEIRAGACGKVAKGHYSGELRLAMVKL